MIENKRVKTLEFMISNGDINAPEFIDNLQQTIKGLTEIGDDYVRCFSSQFEEIEKLKQMNDKQFNDFCYLKKFLIENLIDGDFCLYETNQGLKIYNELCVLTDQYGSRK